MNGNEQRWRHGASAAIGLTALICAWLPPAAAGAAEGQAQTVAYARLVHAVYSDALAGAESLGAAVGALLAAPSAPTLGQARTAWLEARVAYGQSEAFRFYQGPIDFVDPDSGREGPEGLLNSWPVNEAYLDYVVGLPETGIVFDAAFDISPAALAARHQLDDDAQVTTGYHAIEFLLWGQDFDLAGPGNRPATDFVAGTLANDRRRALLAALTDRLIADLGFLVDAWRPGADNFAARFVAMAPAEALARMLTGLATLSAFELASERMAVALDSGDPEDEHSCFSDNTRNDLLYNARGIRNVYFAEYGGFDGAGIDQLVRARDAALDGEMTAALLRTEAAIRAIDGPFDQVLAEPPDSDRRARVEAAIEALYAQAVLLQEIGAALGVAVAIVNG